MTTTDTTAAELDDSIRNGVDTATLFATLDAVKQAPQAASFQFRAHTSGSAAPHPRHHHRLLRGGRRARP